VLAAVAEVALGAGYSPLVTHALAQVPLPAAPHAIELTSTWLALVFVAGALAVLPLARRR
jgi:hypothetical protein